MLARADPRRPRSRRRAASRSTSRAASRSSATPSRTRPTRPPSRSRPPAGAAIAHERRTRRVCAAAERRRPWPAGASRRSLLGALRAAAVGLPARAALRLQRRRERALRRRARSGCSGTPTTRTTSSTRPPSRTCCTSSFALGFGGRDGVSAPSPRDPGDVFAVARALSARARRGRGRAARRGRARGCSTAGSASSPPRCWRSPSCPSTTPTSRSTTCRRWRRCASRWSASAASSRAGGCSTTRSPASGSGSPARRSTPAGSCCCRCWRPRWSAPTSGSARRLGGLALAGVLALAAFLVANPFALLDFDAFRDGLSEQSAASSDGGGKLGLTASSGILYYLETLTWGLGWVPALAALGGAVALAVRDWRRALVLVPAAGRLPALHGHAGPLLRPLAAAGLPAAVPARRLRRGGARGVGARSASRRPRPAWAAAAAGVLLCAQGLVFAIHNDVVLARADTRAAGPRLDGRATSRRGRRW